MTSMLVLDTTSRKLAMFTANVTRSETGLVVRPGLQLPGLKHLAKGASWDYPRSSDSLPVLLIGDGYQAQSSAGFVHVSGDGLPWQKHSVIGWLGDHGLRVIRPRVARLLGRIGFVEEKASTNSNSATADAVMAGLVLLGSDRNTVVIAEGQSDWVSVFRLRLGDQEGILSIDEIDEEHQLERFTVEAVASAWLRSSYRHFQGVGGTLCLARESVLKSSVDLSNEELSGFLVTHMPEGHYRVYRMSTWEAKVLGKMAKPEEGIRATPVTLAQLARMDELTASGQHEAADALSRQNALELSLPIDEWERELLAQANI